MDSAGTRFVPCVCERPKWVELGISKKLSIKHTMLDAMERQFTMDVYRSVQRSKIRMSVHASHPAVAKLKAIARRYVWCPGIVTDIEIMVKVCSDCQM